MEKCDIQISKDMTVNCGNYSSIKPSVSITLKDVNIGSVESKYRELSELLDSMLALEFLSLGREAKSLNDIGFKKQLEYLEECEDKINETLNDFSKKLVKGDM